MKPNSSILSRAEAHHGMSGKNFRSTESETNRAVGKRNTFPTVQFHDVEMDQSSNGGIKMTIIESPISASPAKQPHQILRTQVSPSQRSLLGTGPGRATSKNRSSRVKFRVKNQDIIDQTIGCEQNRDIDQEAMFENTSEDENFTQENSKLQQTFEKFWPKDFKVESARPSFQKHSKAQSQNAFLMGNHLSKRNEEFGTIASTINGIKSAETHISEIIARHIKQSGPEEFNKSKYVIATRQMLNSQFDKQTQDVSKVVKVQDPVKKNSGPKSGRNSTRHGNKTEKSVGKAVFQTKLYSNQIKKQKSEHDEHVKPKVNSVDESLPMMGILKPKEMFNINTSAFFKKTGKKSISNDSDEESDDDEQELADLMQGESRHANIKDQIGIKAPQNVKVDLKPFRMNRPMQSKIKDIKIIFNKVKKGAATNSSIQNSKKEQMQMQRFISKEEVTQAKETKIAKQTKESLKYAHRRQNLIQSRSLSDVFTLIDDIVARHNSHCHIKGDSPSKAKPNLILQQQFSSQKISKQGSLNARSTPNQFMHQNDKVKFYKGESQNGIRNSSQIQNPNTLRRTLHGNQSKSSAQQFTIKHQDQGGFQTRTISEEEQSAMISHAEQFQRGSRNVNTARSIANHQIGQINFYQQPVIINNINIRQVVSSASRAVRKQPQPHKSKHSLKLSRQSSLLQKRTNSRQNAFNVSQQIGSTQNTSNRKSGQVSSFRNQMSRDMNVQNRTRLQSQFEILSQEGLVTGPQYNTNKHITTRNSTVDHSLDDARCISQLNKANTTRISIDQSSQQQKYYQTAHKKQSLGRRNQAQFSSHMNQLTNQAPQISSPQILPNSTNIAPVCDNNEQEIHQKQPLMSRFQKSGFATESQVEIEQTQEYENGVRHQTTKDLLSASVQQDYDHVFTYESSPSPTRNQLDFQSMFNGDIKRSSNKVKVDLRLIERQNVLEMEDMIRILDARNVDMGLDSEMSPGKQNIDHFYEMANRFKTEGPEQRFQDYCKMHCINRKLILVGFQFGEHTATEIAKILTANDCISHLDISKNAIGDSGLQSLLPVLGNSTNIVHLNLEQNNLTPKGAKGLFRALTGNISLISFKIGNSDNIQKNKIGSASIPQLVQMIRKSAVLTFLDLRSVVLSDSGCIQLVHGLKHNQTILEMNLSKNDLTMASIKKLAPILHTTRIEDLDLSCNPLGNAGIKALSENFFEVVIQGVKKRQGKPCSLKRLKLADTNFTAQGGYALMRATTQLNQITLLNLDHNAFLTRNLEHLFTMVKQSKLQTLSVNYCKLTDEGGVVLGEAVSESINLRNVYARANEFRYETAKKFAETLLINDVLQTLDLSNNLINEAGGILLAKSLKSNSCLQKLNLKTNNMRFESGACFVDAMKTNSVIKYLNLQKNPIGMEFLEQVDKMLLRNSFHVEENSLQDLYKNRDYFLNLQEGAWDKIKQQQNNSQMLHNALTHDLDREKVKGKIFENSMMRLQQSTAENLEHFKLVNKENEERLYLIEANLQSMKRNISNNSKTGKQRGFIEKQKMMKEGTQTFLEELLEEVEEKRNDFNRGKAELLAQLQAQERSKKEAKEINKRIKEQVLRIRDQLGEKSDKSAVNIHLGSSDEESI